MHTKESIENTKLTFSATLFDNMLVGLMRLFTVSRIVNHIIRVSISLAVLSVCVLFFKYLHLGKYHDYAAITCQIAAASQIILSGTRSLLLPSIALVFGLGVATRLDSSGLFWGMSQTFYGHLAVVGMIGLLVAALSIRDISIDALSEKEIKLLKFLHWGA